MSHNINHASEEMPYFIRPSLNLDAKGKEAAYQKAAMEIKAMLHGEDNMFVKMVTINSLLKINLPYAYWVGFYCVNNERLTVGPYQGTIGCVHIEFGKGVCGGVAVTKLTKIVEDVTILSEGEDHISCDPNSQSEIVVPVFDKNKNLIGVFDMDSSTKSSFDKIDQKYLEQIMADVFEVDDLITSYQ